jgi:hypothetical protein
LYQVGCTLSNCTVQSFNRSIAADGRALVARADGGKWRFFIQSTQLSLVEIEQQGTLGAFKSKQRYIAPDSAIEIQGQGPVEIYCNNLSSSTAADVETWNAEYLCGGLEPVYFTEDGNTTPPSTAFGDMGSFGGYPAPFTNHCRLYVDAQQVRIKATSPDGTQVFLSGVQPVDERLFIDLDTPQGYKFEIRESNSSVTGVNYGLIWYRE